MVCGYPESPYDGGVYVACQSPDCWCAMGEAYDRDAMPDHQFISEANAIAAWNRRSNPAVRGDRKAGVPCTGVVLPPDSENKSERE